MLKFDSDHPFSIRLDYRAVYIAYRTQDGAVIQRPYTPSGVEFSETIRNYYRQSHNLLVGRFSVEDVLLRLSDESGKLKQTISVRGRNLVTGLPDQIEISIHSINEVVDPLIKQVASIISSNWQHTIPEELHEEVKLKGFQLIDGDFPYPYNFEQIFRDTLSLPIERER